MKSFAETDRTIILVEQGDVERKCHRPYGIEEKPLSDRICSVDYSVEEFPADGMNDDEGDGRECGEAYG